MAVFFLLLRFENKNHSFTSDQNLSDLAPDTFVLNEFNRRVRTFKIVVSPIEILKLSGTLV